MVDAHVYKGKVVLILNFKKTDNANIDNKDGSLCHVYYSSHTFYSITHCYVASKCS